MSISGAKAGVSSNLDIWITPKLASLHEHFLPIKISLHNLSTSFSSLLAMQTTQTWEVKEEGAQNFWNVSKLFEQTDSCHTNFLLPSGLPVARSSLRPSIQSPSVNLISNHFFSFWNVFNFFGSSDGEGGERHTDNSRLTGGGGLEILIFAGRHSWVAP